MTKYPKLSEDNIVFKSDSYKVSHYPQYEEGTSIIESYFESRGGRWKDVVLFGPQMIIAKHLAGEVVTKEKIEEAHELYGLHFGNYELFNKKGWESLLKKHNGKLPLEIKAVPEGTPIPYSNILMKVRNTDPEFYWLTNYVETLLVQSWYPSTVATLSREMKKLILKYLEETGDPAGVDFKLHDFGFRGVSSVESAGIGGAAHLLNFKGTDTIQALVYARNYYNSHIAGFSIPATEHSTITSWGREREHLAYRNLLHKYPTGLLACVSDSYDIFNACENLWGTALKNEVLQRNGTLVVRPDSGNPPTIVVKVLEILGDKFGYEYNRKGFKVLDPHVRVIQGDGIDYDMCNEILSHMKLNGWSADNIAFGMGGALLQKLNRDTQKFAFKCSYTEVNGESRDVYKEPVTDNGKRSKSGILKLIKVGNDGEYRTLTESATLEKDILQTVFLNGELVREYDFEECRANAAI